MSERRNTVIAAAVTGVIAAGLVVFLRTGGAGDGGSLVQVTVPELTVTERQGEAVFNENCAACHGINAAGKDGFGPPLVHIIYEPSHHGDAAFYSAALNGVRQHHWNYGDMAAVPGVTEDDVTAIIAYVRSLQRANGIN